MHHIARWLLTAAMILTLTCGAAIADDSYYLELPSKGISSSKNITVNVPAENEAAEGKTVSAVSEAAELFIPLGDLVDIDKEIARLTKERDSVARDIQRAEGKLGNQGFLAKAPAQLVEQEKEKLAVNRDKLAKLDARIDDLKNM